MPLVAATRTPVSTPDMVQAMIDAWRRELGANPTAGELGVLLAQWSLETGNGASMVQFNVGNFKAPSPGPADLFCYFATEEVVNGVRVPFVPHMPPDYAADRVCRFAAFATLADGCASYLHAQYTRFRSAWSFVVAGDVAGFAAALHAAGYYTAPVDEYVRGMQARHAMLAPIIDRVLAQQAPTDPAPAPIATILPDVTPDAPNTDDDPDA